MAFENEPIGAEQHAGDFILVLVYEGVHGVFLATGVVCNKTTVQQEDAVCIPFWMRLRRVR